MAAFGSNASNPNCNSSQYAPFSICKFRQNGEIGPSKKTMSGIKCALKILKQYCVALGTPLAEVERKSPVELCDFLSCFYAGVRQCNGREYAVKSMGALRYGLQLHFRSVSGVDIIRDELFKPANEVFSAILAKLRADGRGAQQMQYVTETDLEKIMEYVASDQGTPRGLQNKVFVDVLVNYRNIGRQNLRNMVQSDFDLRIDSKGRRYVALRRNNSFGDRMYESPNSYLCPVKSYERYIERLNPLSHIFWQRPKKTISDDVDVIWYDTSPLGKNTLGEKLKEISKEANCSLVYTNCCLHAKWLKSREKKNLKFRFFVWKQNIYRGLRNPKSVSVSPREQSLRTPQDTCGSRRIQREGYTEQEAAQLRQYIHCLDTTRERCIQKFNSHMLSETDVSIIINHLWQLGHIDVTGRDSDGDHVTNQQTCDVTPIIGTADSVNKAKKRTVEPSMDMTVHSSVSKKRMTNQSVSTEIDDANCSFPLPYQSMCPGSDDINSSFASQTQKSHERSKDTMGVPMNHHTVTFLMLPGTLPTSCVLPGMPSTPCVSPGTTSTSCVLPGTTSSSSLQPFPIRLQPTIRNAAENV
ncbi:uncharacterized protein [Ptychodera flava]|uniref:uncharacterized protein n=1 Tax=Ptychodera flava TaxID=63121 RepID=UPI00396A12B1